MAVNKIILFYGFTPVKDPEAVRLWQKTLCEFLGLLGRIIISPHGINVTLGGEINNLKRYVKEVKSYPGLRKIDVKWSEGSAEDFPRLSVKARKELVAFGMPEELRVAKERVLGGGKHLKPAQVHELVENKRAAGEEVVFFDGRNTFEAKIGKFKNAVVPDVNTTHDFIAELESGKYDELKDKPVITYCTGGIRCEILSSLMINRGFSEVYQIDGGIVRYGEAFGDRGLWEGSLYVFDRRRNISFTNEAMTVGSCERCGAATSNFENCSNVSCRKLQLICHGCLENKENRQCPGGCLPTPTPKKDIEALAVFTAG